jgi:multidrug efflux pump subunit AcrA (membrane-fusion protein)
MVPDLFSSRAARLGVVLVVVSAGCSQPERPAPAVHTDPQVHVVLPELRSLSRSVGQPGYIDAFEQTSIYAKVAGYVKDWKVDIGDRIKKDQLLVELEVPELVAEFQQKQAQAELDEILIKQTEQLVDVAQNNWKVATAQVQEAKNNVGKYQAAVERWESEVKRLTGLVAQKVVDKQVLDESQKQLKSNRAERDAAQTAIVAAEATELARKADYAKSQVDVDAAKARAKVSQADAQRLAALVKYTRITAPYDGVVVVRNANTGDFVRPGSGDQSTPRGIGDQSASRGSPIYVVARTDIVRIYVDVSEKDANFVKKGTKARVRVQALADTEIEASLTRTSWALNVQSRTLRTEIDIPNRDGRLRPGMYAYGMVLIDRSNVRTVPLAAIVEIGNHNCCFLHQDGKAVKTPVQCGITEGSWMEVTKKLVNGDWVDFTGSEQVILGDLAQLGPGQAVRLATTPLKN